MIATKRPLRAECACGNRARFPALYAGSSVPCPHCQAEVRVPDLGSAVFDCHLWRASQEPLWDRRPILRGPLEERASQPETEAEDPAEELEFWRCALGLLTVLLGVLPGAWAYVR